MSYTFPSYEWAQQFREKINSSDSYASAASNWEGDIVLSVENGGGIYLDLWHGECREAAYYAVPSDRNAAYRLSATIEGWRQILDGRLDPIKAIVTRQIKLDGNLIRIMKHVKAAQELVACAARVDTNF
jgi:putative sterol carrier protein